MRAACHQPSTWWHAMWRPREALAKLPRVLADSVRAIVRIVALQNISRQVFTVRLSGAQNVLPAAAGGSWDDFPPTWPAQGESMGVVRAPVSITSARSARWPPSGSSRARRARHKNRRNWIGERVADRDRPRRDLHTSVPSLKGSSTVNKILLKVERRNQRNPN